MKNFVKLCKMSQKDLKDYAFKRLKNTYQNVVKRDGFVYAQGTFPVLLVAHLDTVHKRLPQNVFLDNVKGHLYSLQGIGGDDRCGVYMIFEIIKKYNCSVLFCEDEEIGTVGAKKFINSPTAKKVDVNYIIELDRKGSNDAVFYDCDNPDFEEFITAQYFSTAQGSFSDISVLAPALKRAAVNLSCGYYNAHTLQEYVKFNEMQEIIKQVCGILAKTNKATVFEYIEIDYLKKYSRWDMGYDWYGLYDDAYMFMWYEDGKEEPECDEIVASSEFEAIGKFCFSHPTIPYKDVTAYPVR